MPARSQPTVKQHDRDREYHRHDEYDRAIVSQAASGCQKKGARWLQVSGSQWTPHRRQAISRESFGQAHKPRYLWAAHSRHCARLAVGTTAVLQQLLPCQALSC